MTFNSNIEGKSGGTRRGGGSPSGGGGMNFRGSGGGGGGLSRLIIMLLMTRGGRGGIIAAIVIAVILFFANGGLGLFGGSGDPASNSTSGNPGGEEIAGQCQTAEDFNNNDDCRIDGTAVSLDQVWSQVLPDQAGIEYTEPRIMITGSSTQTGCGVADASASGPFYCPGDETVYISPDFFAQLKQMGGSDGPFAQMYVVAHEVGHHIQNLQGTIGLSDYNNPGADSNAVKMELQADCYAGLWAHHADQGEDVVLEPLTDDQISQAIQTAQAIGDDHIQESSGQDVDSEEWTHGSSEQRQQSFKQGYDAGTMAACHQDFQR